MKEFKKRKINNQSGAAMLIAIVFFLFISLAIISGLVSPSIREVANASTNLNSKKSYFLAESGTEDAIYRIKKSMTISESETITLNSNSVITTIITLPGNTKEVSSLGNVFGYQRKTKATLSTDIGVSFNYGVHAGEGGLQMDNNTRVIGNVYANGDIVGTSGGATITETAIVAGATGKIDAVSVNGDANAHFLEDITVGRNSFSASLLRGTVAGNAVSDSISSCTINGNATYDTQTSCTILGSQTTPNPTNYVDPSPVPFPISDAQITAWEQEAIAGGTISSQTYNSGSQTLGPKKINGNLTLNNTAELIMTGTIWVTGKVYFNNSSKVRLSPSYGNTSGVLLAGVKGSTSAGEIELNNSSFASGSGQPGSYLMFLSQRVGTSDAIDLENNITAGIAYAPYGTIEITNNNAGVKEATGWRVHLQNNSTITYESGLPDVNFTGGPSGAWSVQGWGESE